MSFRLKDQIIKDFQNILFDFPQVEQVIIYGSRAKGNYKQVSDTDHTLKGNHLNLKTLNQIHLRIDDLFLFYTFALSVFGFIDNEELVNHIEGLERIFYQKDLAKTLSYAHYF